MDLDVVLLSRLQFALTIMVHYLFPPLSIGLGAQLVITEGLYLRTKDRRWEALARFWTKLFAVNFAVGVATGIVMEFEFGTNWATYSRFVGDVFGSALASEGIFAFFLESGFLAVLVFGWDRVGPKMHFFSTLMVFTGSVFSSVWIVIANSWMHTPAGYHLVEENGRMRAEITDFWAMCFNPSSMHRLGHVLLGAFILGAFFTMSISAWYVLKKRHEDLATRSFKVGLVMAALSSVAMLVSGHGQARALAANQPAKLAALEGHFHTGEGPTDLYIMGWPDRATETVHFGIALPGMLSFLVHDDFETPIPGLDQVPDDEEPPVLLPFLTYHVMVGCGMYFIGLTLFGLFMWWRGKLFTSRWLMWIFVGSVLLPYVANQAGWVATEVGRQPWIVYGLLRTADAVSRSVPTDQVLGSIALFSFIYLALVVLWVVVLNEKIKHGPEDPATLGPHAAEPFRDAAARLSLVSPHRLTGDDASDEEEE
ncbi:MAG: cytochrome ubiquinol oxidase subunit I [Sandaracinaceae bacterium]|nr:cytochrome ubiquinol oxidase subunit I [Sandaracinaceae bacterium]